MDQLLYPSMLSDLYEKIPPVQCMIWRGGKEYERISLGGVYPFDTIYTIKHMIYTALKNDPNFLPRFTFVGVPVGDQAYSLDAPSVEQVRYLPIDYLWYPSGSNDASQTYQLFHPAYTATHPDDRFVKEDGMYASPNYEVMGRSTIEDVFLKKRDNQLPVFHVFTLRSLRTLIGGSAISEEVWNGQFSPYFPDVPVNGPYQAAKDDLEFGKKLQFIQTKRQEAMERLDLLLEENVPVPTIELTGIRNMLLTWKKPVKGFEGSASLFYRIPATEKRPYLRLIPAEGTAVTKLHVRGVIPIPTLEDPSVLDGWGKEVNPDPGYDFCSIKYVHRPSIGNTQPIYGTIHVLNDGTMNLLLQPPKKIRQLDPVIDFRHFRANVAQVFDGLSQPFDRFQLKECAIVFTVRPPTNAKKFTRARLLQRLPFFSSLFKEIAPLPDESPVISLRYKAVSQYATEDKIFTFITQWNTQQRIGEREGTILDAVQEEFQFTRKEAIETVADYQRKQGIFTVQVPEDGEFMESFNPGIDLHIYSNAPLYHVHIHRIDSYETYRRLFTLLSLLFIDQDDYFDDSDERGQNAFSAVSEEVEEQLIEQEESRNWGKQEAKKGTAAQASMKEFMTPRMGHTSSTRAYLDDPFSEPEMAASAAASASVSAQPAAKAATAAATKSVDDQKLVNPTSWFINKLKSIDKRLFDFKTDKASNGYSRKCAAQADRQPAVLTKDQYDRMRAIYENDLVFWVVFPLNDTEEPVAPIGTEETITIMRFGSDPDRVHYYFCPEYFCLNDEIMIRPKDFASTTDREGNRKEKDSCPFCGGRLITNNEKPERGRTVMHRQKSEQSSTYHKFIDFMGKTTHPDGLALPCCFVKQSTLRIADKEFSHLRDVLKKEDLDANAPIMEEEEDQSVYQDLVFRASQSIQYGVLLESIHKAYILDSNKHPDPGIFATAPRVFDEFFKQDSAKKIVDRVHIHLKLRPTAQGFLRLGTENTPYESLLGAIAPIIYRNSIQEVKQKIKEVMVPRIFLNSHFGNLVLEFFNPSDASAMPENRMELMQWSQDHLQIAMTGNNYHALLRIFNAFHRFIRFIDDPSKRKDLRHIQPLLAEPGLFTLRGIQLVIMEEHGSDPVTIQCPIFGVSVDRNRKNDVAFLSRSMRSIHGTEQVYSHYELYVHTSNKPAKGGEAEVHEPIVRWDYPSRKFWPEIVQLRIDEYMTQCQSRYRSIYTAQDGVHPMAMIPLSKAVQTSSIRPEGVVKDSYNHVIGLTFQSKGGSSYLVALPVVDDGVITISSSFSIPNIYLDWADVKLAPVEDAVKYYRLVLDPLFFLYPGYRIQNVVRRKGLDMIVAIQLLNGLYVPVGPPKNMEAFDKLGLPMVDVDEFEWEMDKKIATEKDCGSDPALLEQSSYSDWEEGYQQFRLMVANWITSDVGGPVLRRNIQDIIFRSELPEYERRKRLYLLLSSTLLSWFYADSEEWEKGVSSFLRKDCRMIDGPEACTGSCYWKQDEGKCLLHVHTTTSLSDQKGARDVSTPELFTKRVIDELVRFPARRRQLMRGEISIVSKMVEPIHEGDQYIIPESSPTWTNLLRLDWMRQMPEEPKYHEEMTGQEEDKKMPEGEMVPELQALLGENTPYRIKFLTSRDPEQPLMLLTSLLSTTFEQLGMDPSGNEISVEHLMKYVRHRTKPIGLIQFRNPQEQAIQFVKPPGYFDSVMVLVVLADRVGILLEEDGNTVIQTSSLPEAVRARWESAGIVEPKKRPMPGMEEKIPVVIGQPVFQREFAKPLAAAQAPPAPPVMISQARRRPQVGVEESPVQPVAASVQPVAASVQPSIQPSVQPSVSAMKNSRRKPRIGNV